MADLSNRRWHRLLEGLDAAVLVVDADDTVIAWTRGAERLYEMRARDVLGRRFRDLDVSYRVEGLRAGIEALKAGAGSDTGWRRLTVSLERRSGARLRADLRLAPVLDEDGAVVGVFVAGGDTTEVRRLEAELDVAEAQRVQAVESMAATNAELETTVEELQAVNVELATLNAELERRTDELTRARLYQERLLDGLEPAVVALDPDFVVTVWNAAAARCWRLPADQAVGRGFFALRLAALPASLPAAVRRVTVSGEAEVLRDRSCGEGWSAVRVAPLAAGPEARPGVVLTLVPTPAAGG